MSSKKPANYTDLTVPPDALDLSDPKVVDAFNKTIPQAGIKTKGLNILNMEYDIPFEKSSTEDFKTGRKAGLEANQRIFDSSVFNFSGAYEENNFKVRSDGTANIRHEEGVRESVILSGSSEASNVDRSSYSASLDINLRTGKITSDSKGTDPRDKALLESAKAVADAFKPFLKNPDAQQNAADAGAKPDSADPTANAVETALNEMGDKKIPTPKHAPGRPWHVNP